MRKLWRLFNTILNCVMAAGLFWGMKSWINRMLNFIIAANRRKKVIKNFIYIIEIYYIYRIENYSAYKKGGKIYKIFHIMRTVVLIHCVR